MPVTPVWDNFVNLVMMTGISQAKKISKPLSLMVIVLLFSVSLHGRSHPIPNGKAHHFELVKDQPVCFVSGVKVKPNLFKEFRSTDLVSFLRLVERASKLLPNALLVGISERNIFYSLITINAP